MKVLNIFTIRAEALEDDYFKYVYKLVQCVYVVVPLCGFT